MNKIKKPNFLFGAFGIVLIVGGVGAAALIGGGVFRGPASGELITDQKEVAAIEASAPELAEVAISAEQRYPYTIAPRSSLVAELRKLDISPRDIHDLVAATKSVRNLGRLTAGTRFQVGFSPTQADLFTSLRIRITPRDVLVIERQASGAWVAEALQKTVDTKVLTFKGNVKTSLWESAVEAQMNPVLIAELAEIFAWQVDFAREVRVGDQWRLSVEEESVQGERLGSGSILSAEYTNAGETHTAILFRRGEEDLGYFGPDGTSLKRVFLKSPIQYGRISSRFQKRRMHPVLKTVRPHNGVDYAAPTGTPIRVVGDGQVEVIGRNGGAGNFIKIRHNSTYSTAYKHMSRFAKNMKRGSRVQQGQTIGYVGSTGLSSGPHLHFEFYVNGRYVDPLGMKFPAAAPVPREQLAEFTQSKNAFLAYLPDWEM